jgi:heat shock protein 90kDa beta
VLLQEETQEYADELKLKELVGKYSEFINFPIHLWSSREVEREVPADEADADTDSEDADSADDVEDASDEKDVSDESEGGC